LNRAARGLELDDKLLARGGEDAEIADQVTQRVPIAADL